MSQSRFGDLQLVDSHVITLNQHCACMYISSFIQTDLVLCYTSHKVTVSICVCSCECSHSHLWFVQGSLNLGGCVNRGVSLFVWGLTGTLSLDLRYCSWFMVGPLLYLDTQMCHVPK